MFRVPCLGETHPKTLASRSGLALGWQDAGRPEELTSFFRAVTE